MGIYDIYGKTQLKIGTPSMKSYKVGDKVDIPDGIYIGHDGFVVIVGGKFVAEFDQAFSKWGDTILSGSIITELNPLGRQLFGKAKK